jgi:hypothetical protein
LIVSGESHTLYQGSVKRTIEERVRQVVDKLPVKFEEAHIKPPTETKPYKPTNLGPYGSTNLEKSVKDLFG